MYFQQHPGGSALSSAYSLSNGIRIAISFPASQACHTRLELSNRRNEASDARAVFLAGRPGITRSHIRLIHRISSDHPEWGEDRIAPEFKAKLGV